LQLMAACRGALNGLMAEVIEGHVRFHVLRPSVSKGSPHADAAEELIEVVRAYLKRSGELRRPAGTEDIMASTDLGQSEALKIAKPHDPNGSRSHNGGGEHGGHQPALTWRGINRVLLVAAAAIAIWFATRPPSPYIRPSV
jgi:hypothetical protein